MTGGATTGATTGDVGNMRGGASGVVGVGGIGPPGEAGSFPLLAINRCIIPFVPVWGVNRRVYPFVLRSEGVIGGEGAIGPSRCEVDTALLRGLCGLSSASPFM